MTPSGSNPNAQAQVQQEVAGVIAILSKLTGLTSRWNGEVELAEDMRTFGRKPFSCRIVLNERLADQPVRWRTLIHEALHSFSAGYNMTDYQEWLGWEEGVIEQTQRLLRPSILRSLGIQVSETVFEPIESGYAFNKYIRALEQLRAAIGQEDALEFYLSLLATRIKHRSGFILGIGNQLASDERRFFVGVFSQTNSVLKEAP